MSTCVIRQLERCVVRQCVVYGMRLFFFFFKQKTAYEIGTGDWSSDVCSSDLIFYQLFDYLLVIGDAVFEHAGTTWSGSIVRVLPDRKSVV